jgi:nucleotide-binding universal stress UspA family protein
MDAFKRILVPLDGSATSDAALNAALDLARLTGARLRLVHAIDEMAYLGEADYSGQVIAQARATAQQVLDHGLAAAKAAGVEAETNLIDSPGQRLGHTIADEARAFDADLIVAGSHGRRGLGRVLLGSGAEQIMRMATVPVMVVKAPPQT